MNPFEIYDALKMPLGDDTAKVLISYIGEIRDGLATKEDVVSLRGEFAEVKQRSSQVEGKMSQVEGEISRLADIIAHLESNVTRLESKVDDLGKNLTNFRVEVKDEIWKLKIYIILLAVLMLITNPTVLDLLSKLPGIFKP
ncbi:hypothetical protein L0337_46455 [candidate division KSB1 bacterium]|nr:hypothetical protein [candidate division KSB1 bacterium]